MEELRNSFSKFKNFLNILFIRRKKAGFNDNDFKKEDFKYIQHHLEELLTSPLMSIEEAQRIKIYFHNAYVFHLNNGLGIANIFPQRSLTPDPVIVEDDEVEQSFNQKRHEDGEKSAQQGHENQLQTVDNSELYSQQFVPNETPLECDYLIQTQKSGPLMQSTPLSAALLPGETEILNEQQQEKGLVQDVFIADIISQINISPIPVESAPLRTPNIQATSMPTLNPLLNEVPFLRNFVNIEGGEIFDEQPPPQNMPGKSRKRPNVNILLREAKKMLDNVKFDVLYQFSHKRTNQQKRSEESFLYFPLTHAKHTYITSRSNTILPESERDHSSLQRMNNFSNILRAHASQGQTSVEQPVQISQVNSTRSPLTPQGLMRTSLPFTPLRGDISDFEPRMVIDQATNFPTRSLLRQQPLLPIPERESLIHIPFNPQVENMNINDLAATFSHLPRADLENIEMLEGPSLQIAYNDPSQNQTHQNKIPLNSSDLNMQPLVDHEPIFPLGLAEDQPSNVPERISGDFEIIEKPQPPVEPLTLSEQILAMDREIETCERLVRSTDVPTSLPNFIPEQQLQQSVAEDATVPQNDNLEFSWFEILRPRGDLIEYPRQVPTRRRKRRRRRDSAERIVRPRRQYELPVIPRSPSHENMNDLTLAPVGGSDQVPDQNQQSNSSERINDLRVETNFPENQISSSAQYSEEPNGISQQITQYPIQIETQLKNYMELIKRAGRKLDYVNWERFDPCLFNENDCFEMYTNIFKKIIKDNYVTMDKLYEHGTSRLEAAKGFRFILDLKTMGLIEIESIQTQILGIRLISSIDIQKL